MATSQSTTPDKHRLRFRRRDRLHGGAAFKSVYDGKVRKHAGPFTVFSLPNGLEHGRLGLSVSRKVGNAVRRSRVKRMLREAFRLSNDQRPVGFDWVVVVRPHEPMTLEDYGRLFNQAAINGARVWSKANRTVPPSQTQP
ncbi:MAG: ribonuclease P protein component [Algisphaera sp.]